MFPMPWTPPYYERYFVDTGYAHAYPFWNYEVDFASERHRDFTQRALASPECTCARSTSAAGTRRSRRCA